MSFETIGSVGVNVLFYASMLCLQLFVVLCLVLWVILGMAFGRSVSSGE